MSDFCLPPTPKSARAASKVEQNLEKLRKCSTAAYKLGLDSRAALRVEQNHPKLRKCSTVAYKFDSRGLESRTKSRKIGKMFYSDTFAKAVWSQIMDKSQKAPFCP